MLSLFLRLLNLSTFLSPSPPSLSLPRDARGVGAPVALAAPGSSVSEFSGHALQLPWSSLPDSGL